MAEDAKSASTPRLYYEKILMILSEECASYALDDENDRQACAAVLAYHLSGKPVAWLAQVCDVDGLPRAWAVAVSVSLAKAGAERKWAQRVAQRTADGTLDRSEERGEMIVTPLIPPEV